ncbi:hypothetical protein BCV70DRAFT_163797 [Testicularia cyperi]|uniref:Uncharacterized protein n=1 Tax=Testicularia cyperi TaxID=1882483 RepID=A0A317XKP1_9BASI|nr:hypothetical protein BCV70DRAFT_163797 [Testicularia cyperi]
MAPPAYPPPRAANAIVPGSTNVDSSSVFNASGTSVVPALARPFPSVKLPERNSIASDDSAASSAGSVDSPRLYSGTSRPVSHTTMATSRPSSIASNASSSSQVHGQLTACADLLSPGLATALGLLPPNHPAAASSSSSGTRSAGNSRDPSARRRVRAQSTHGTGLANRRPSMPIVPSMNHRMSVASISSFESLPEDETVHGFLAPQALYHRPRHHTGGGISNVSDTVAAVPAAASVPSSPTTFSHSVEDPAHFSSFSGHGHALREPSSSQASTASASSMRPSVFLRRAVTDPVQVTDNSALMARRRRSAKELLDTERSYVSSLTLIDQEYYQPLLTSLGRNRSSGLMSPPLGASGAILSRKSMGDIFSNFADILHLSKELLSRLEERLSDTSTDDSVLNDLSSSRTAQGFESGWNPRTDTVGDILVTLAPFLKMYSLFVKNFSGALQRIESEQKSNDSFARFLRDTEKRRWAKERSAAGADGRQAFGFGLGFQAHLLTIVQRIPRYKLLVDDLIKCTPEGHPDRSDLMRAGQMIEQVASYINENVRQHEMVLTMLGLQRSLQGLSEPLVVPGRALIRRGTLMKTCRRNIQPREFFLFTDCLLYASPISGGIESASAAWQMLAQKGSLYGGPVADPAPLSPLSGTPSGTSSPIESVLSSASSLTGIRARTTSVPEPYTPLAGAIFSLAGHQLQFRAKFALRDCTVVSVEDNINDGLRHCFEIRTPDKSFAVYAETSPSKEAWVTAIREARADFMSARRTLKAEEDSIEAKRERRRSLYKIDVGRHSNRRLSTQSLGAYLAGTSLAGHDSTINESEGEATAEVAVNVAAETAMLPTIRNPPPQRSRVDSLPNILRPPSFPSFPTAGTNLSLANLLGPGAGIAAAKPLRVLEDYNAPVWVPDNRADKCCNCSEPFGMWRRKHHCRLCGQVVCWTCSQRSFLIPSYQEGEEDRPARACDRCYDSVFPADSPDEMVLQNNLQLRIDVSSDAEPELTSAEMTSAPSTDESISTALSNYRLDSDGGDDADADAVPGTPLTPAKDESPGISRAHSPMCDSPASTELSAPAVPFVAPVDGVVTDVDRPRASRKAQAARPKSLRFEEHAQTSSTAGGNVRGLSARPELPSMPQLPTRSKSLSGSALRLPMPGMQNRRSALEAQLFTSNLSPQIQAATSGSGTFRLVTPRLTTPESELPPKRASHAPSSISIMEEGYFGGVAIVEGVEESEPTPRADMSAFNTGTSPAKASEPFRPSTVVHGPNGIPAHLRPQQQRKRPMSAAARLSTFYGPLLSAERKK